MKWFYAYDRTNYARHLPLYWAEMKNLPNTCPEVHQKFLQDEFSAQRSSVRGFSQTAVDQTVEQTVNKSTNTKGGIIGFSLKKGSVQRWLITARERASSSLKLKEMIGLNTNKDDIHKEFRAPRLAEDENDVERAMSVIKGWVDPFDGPEELVCISSGVTVSPEIKQDLFGAERAGNTELLKDRIVSNNVSFFDPLPQQNLKTFKDTVKTNIIEVNGKERRRKADRKLFGRLAVIA